jgi:hypothetical protein
MLAAGVPWFAMAFKLSRVIDESNVMRSEALRLTNQQSAIMAREIYFIMLIIPCFKRPYHAVEGLYIGGWLCGVGAVTRTRNGKKGNLSSRRKA